MIETWKLTMDALGGRERTVRVWVPELAPGERAGVLYMPDAQNLFRDEDATFGTSWKFPETLERLGLRLFVVGWDSIDHLMRLDELGPWVNDWIQHRGAGIDRPVGGDAHRTLAFAVDQLKPLIDARYPTRADREHCWVAGSSMGGLFALYALGARPDVFSRAACFSSAFWYAGEHLFAFLDTVDVGAVERLYLDVGTMEGSRRHNEEERLSYLADTQRVHDVLRARGLPAQRLKLLIDGGGKHNEAAWSRRLPKALSWLLGDQGGNR